MTNKRKVSLSLDADLVDELEQSTDEGLSGQVNEAVRVEVERRRRQRALSHHGTAGPRCQVGRGSSTRRQKEPHAERSRPVSSVSHRSLTHLGMDVHKDSISVAILRP